MSQTTRPPDALDLALSAFFKAEMLHPWPAAPVPMTATPSSLATTRRYPGGRARLTLAASVALLLGTGWFLTNGLSTGDRARPARAAGGGFDVLDGATAKTPDAFGPQRKAKAKEAKDPMAGFQPGPVTLP